MPIKALIFSGYGINCEEETKYAFELAGIQADIVHINDLIASRSKLQDYQIMSFPGGFSYGDDMGSGKAYAHKLKNNLMDEIQAFIARDTLTIGICNGFQILTQLGLVQGALTHNDSAQFICRWVDLKVESKSPWLEAIDTISLPIAHGEGKYIKDSDVDIALKYIDGDISEYAANPNGSEDDIAAVLAQEGRILAMMPHPERAVDFSHLPNWLNLKESLLRRGEALPERGPGQKIFDNAFAYFS